MAYETNELVSSNSRAAAPRFFPTRMEPKTFDGVSGAPLLAQLYPVAKRSDNGFWVPWTRGTDEVSTISETGTTDGGTFTITVNGFTTATIAYNATAAVIQLALENLANVEPGDVVATGGPVGTADVILTWGGNFKGQTMTITLDDGSVTGGGTVDIAQTTAGAGADNGEDVISGFVGDVEGVQLHATNEVIGLVVLAGDVHRDDVVLPDGESQSDLDTALKSSALRALGINVKGLANVG